MSMKAEATRQGQAGGEEIGRYPIGVPSSAETGSASRAWTNAEPQALMEIVLKRENLMCAYERVVRNKGAPGVDGMPVSELKAYLQQHWRGLKARLLAGEYWPRAVRAVSIPKPQGGVRTLGIPTVVDRLIQQALHQVLSPIFEPGFSAASYGFRPGRSAQQAVKAARAFVADNRRWVVDMDLEKFFDRVNHDVLMERLSRKIADRRVLTLIRRYLEAGMMADGLMSPRREGTPQGGPLSPLLSNILLTDLDRELERRGHRFVRYADDCNIYVRSRRAGERVLAGLSTFLSRRLRLTVNTGKSAVAHPWQRKFLGYSLTAHRQPRLRVAPESLRRLQERLRVLLRHGRGRSLGRLIAELNPVLRGWAAYFHWTESQGPLEALDGWLRRKLRCVLWRQWKHGRTRARHLVRLGLDPERARRSTTNGRGPWWNAGASHMNQAVPKRLLDRLGLVSVLETTQRLSRVS